MKDPRPKRRKDKLNPYTIFSIGIHTTNPRYYISFVDRENMNVCLEINRALFELFDQFELEDLSYMNEVDNHYEFQDVSDSSIQRRAIHHKESIEDSIERKVWISDALNILTQKQRRRLVLYYYHGFTYEQIAQRERCTIRAVVKSIKSAERLLKKFLQ